jgi:multidrug efflux system membrane fusion protein
MRDQIRRSAHVDGGLSFPRALGVGILAVFTGWFGEARAEFLVERQKVEDIKAVFGTVQAVVEVPARARISGTLQELSVDDGSLVQKGEVLARIVDQKLILQRKALDARIAAFQSSVDNIQLEYDRAKKLFDRGTIAQARIDQLETQLAVASNTLKASEAERAVLEQQLSEGEVLAPASGRVLDVPVTAGSVVMGGEVIAMVAQEGFLLRIEVPERHARFMKVGDAVSLTREDDGNGDGGSKGEVVKVYPQIRQGRVIADAEVPGLGDFFVGERIEAAMSVGTRDAFVIPQDYVTTRFGLDFVKVAGKDGAALEVVVQLGRTRLVDGVPFVEVHSGLKGGDTLVRP